MSLIPTPQTNTESSQYQALCAAFTVSVAVLDKSTRKLYRLQEHLWEHTCCTAVCKLNAPTLQCWSEALRTSRRRIIPRRGILHICGIREESTIRWRRYLPPTHHHHLLQHQHARAAYNLHLYCAMPRSSLFFSFVSTWCVVTFQLVWGFPTLLSATNQFRVTQRTVSFMKSGRQWCSEILIPWIKDPQFLPLNLCTNTSDCSCVLFLWTVHKLI